MTELYRRCRARGFRPTHVAEVGVYLPETSNVGDFAQEGTRATLVEAHPDYVAAIRTYFAAYPNVELHAVAIADAPGELRLVTRGPSTFAEDVAAPPSVVNDAYERAEEDVITVAARRFDEIDDGTIDLLSVDVEGSEWFVIKHMDSRPAVVSIETHGKRYVNPHLAQIRTWMRDRAYRVWYRDASDTVYVRGAEIDVTAADRVRLAARTARLTLRRWVSGAKAGLRG